MGTKLILAVTIIARAAAGSAAAKPSRTVAVGNVQGTEAYAAVTYDGHRLRAYACDGSGRPDQGRQRRDDRRLYVSQPTCGPPSWARRVAISVTARPM
jgi:hypothetical protein